MKFLVFMTDGANNESNECTNQEVWVESPATGEYWWKKKKYGSIKYRYSKPKNWRKWNYVPAQPKETGHFEDQEVCELDYHFDVRSLAACGQMKAAGVSIFAIAYDIAKSQKDHAESFLQNCSSGAGFFKSADDSTALEAAFEQIGDSILTEVIRIKR